jgi:hypothetical protein
MADGKGHGLAREFMAGLPYDDNIHNVPYATDKSEQSCDTIYPAWRLQGTN